MTNKLVLAGDSIAKGIVFDGERKRYTRAWKDGYAEGLETMLNIDVEQVSKIGWTVSEVQAALGHKLDELADKLDNADTNIVAIEVGGNDCDFDWQAVADSPEFDHQPKTPIEKYMCALIGIIDDIRARGLIPALVNLPPIDADRYFKAFTHGSREMGEKVLRWLGQVGKIYWWHERYNSALEHVAEITSTAVINIRHALLRKPNYREYISDDGIHPTAEGHKLILNEVISYIKRHRPCLFKDKPVKA